MNTLKRIKTERSPLTFTIESQREFARSAILSLPHGDVKTPIYMPVGTKGTIKGLTSREMENLDCWLLLGNTYHLNSHPGSEYLASIGGLRAFMRWKRNILTDSGGFQMVSLAKLSKVTEDGVTFEHPSTKAIMHLRPEDSIKAQISIGADIMMALDDVVSSTLTGPRVKEACERTIRWIDRNIEAHTNTAQQNLFPIIQGSTDKELRDLCLDALIAKNARGYAIGGLSGGENKVDFIRTVHYCCQKLPKDKPRYLMGVGVPVDLIICAALGVDMFDCVFATRTARFGTALTDNGNIKLKSAEFKNDFNPIDKDCDCEVNLLGLQELLKGIH